MRRLRSAIPIFTGEGQLARLRGKSCGLALTAAIGGPTTGVSLLTRSGENKVTPVAEVLL